MVSHLKHRCNNHPNILHQGYSKGTLTYLHICTYMGNPLTTLQIGQIGLNDPFQLKTSSLQWCKEHYSHSAIFDVMCTICTIQQKLNSSSFSGNRRIFNNLVLLGPPHYTQSHVCTQAHIITRLNDLLNKQSPAEGGRRQRTLP